MLSGLFFNGILDGFSASVFISNPVAITVTRICPSMFSLLTVPNIILASSCAVLVIRVAASSTSARVMSPPPVILISICRAPSILASSRSGLEIAFSAASIALFSPAALPLPIIALPILPIIVFTSAKSKLTNPGVTIKSEILPTACCKTSSTIPNALVNEVCLPTKLNSF